MKTAEGAFWSELVLDRGALGRYRLDELRDDLLIAECDSAREFRLRLIRRSARLRGLGRLGGRGRLAGVAECGGGLGGGGLGGLLGGAGGPQRLGERVCLGGGLGGLGGGGAVGDLARALVLGMTTGLGLFSAPGIGV